MCLAIPMLIESLEGTAATASAGGSKLDVNDMLVEDVAVGDYVLVHAGFAIKKIDELEAATTIRTLNELAQAGDASMGTPKPSTTG